MGNDTNRVFAGEVQSYGARLKRLLRAPDLSFLMEAHNGLTAKIVAEEGFEGVWASGLSISSSLGVRDRNEASWTQILEVLEFMVDSARIPILVDGDTGHGDFNNVRRFVRKLCQRGLAGVCIEDKEFPKTNSFLSEKQPLVSIEEFSGKIRAAQDSKTDDDFCIVARIEALISGHGMSEAIRRAEAYHQAGADAILIHSKKSTADEVLAFMGIWGDRCPVVIVPTKYATTPTSAFAQAGVSTVIWANHNLRSVLSAVRATTRQIFVERSVAALEGSIASVDDVFRMVDMHEIDEAEKRYLPSR
jgi:phosphoenolpyruvate phosphomutase